VSELAAFVSYSHRDDAFVIALARALEAAGRNVWLDADDIPPGATWRTELGTAIEAADAFIFVLSPESVRSEECQAELRRAVEIGKRLVALDHRPTDRPPPELTEIQWIRSRDADDMDRIVEEVGRALDTDHEYVSAHTHWLARSLRWSEHGRERSQLLRGRELAAAEEWLASAAGHEPAPIQLQRDFIHLGRRAERTRQRRVLAATATALAVALVLAAVAFVQRNTAERERRVAESRELAANALLTLNEDPELSLILSERAAEVDGNAQVEDALRQALLASRVKVTLSGHPNQLSGVAYSPDGATIATASRDGTGRLWDAASGETRAVLKGHTMPISGIEFGPDGRRLITYAQDFTARVWDTSTGDQIAALEDTDDNRLTDATLSPDGRHAATSPFVHGSVRIWDLERAETVLRLPVNTVNDVEFSPDGRLLVSTDQDNTALLWDLETGAVRHELAGHRGHYVWAAEFSRDGQLIATAGADRTARLWDTRTGAALRVLGGHREDIKDVAFAPGGRLLLTRAEDRTVRIWNVANGRLRAELAHDAAVTDASFSRDGELVVTTDADGVARVWSTAGGEPVAMLRGHRGPVRAAAFGPGALVVTAGADGIARVWDASPGNPAVVAGGRQTLHEALTPSSPADRAVVSYDLPFDDSAACLLVELRSAGEPRDCRLTPGRAVLAADDRGQRVLTGPFIEQGPVTIESATDGEVLATLDGSADAVGASFGPGGRVAAATEEGMAGIWDAESGRRLRSVRAADDVAVLGGFRARATSARISADGKRLVTASDDRTVRIFDAATGRQLQRLEGLPPLVERIHWDADALFSPDGTRILGHANWSDTALIWDARSGRRQTELIGHVRLLTSARFSPGGAFVVTTDGNDVRLWDSVSGRQLAVFGRGEEFSGPSFATFLPDGHTIAVFNPVYDAGGELTLYDCQACRSVKPLAELAAARVTRPLSQAERAKYLHEE
jgi:WD40 repeat protein